MKLLSSVAVLASIVLSGYALAQTTTAPTTTPMTKADCDKAGMKWDATANGGKGGCHA